MVVAAPSARPEAAPVKDVFTSAVDRAAAEQAVPAELIHSVIKIESNYNPFAISPKGAQGLMQLIPATARRFGVANPSDPVENIQGGVKYLKYLLDLYHGDYPLALAAYNAGEQAVARYGGVPPYAETRNYVDLVQKQLQHTGKSAAGATEASPAPTEPAGPVHIQEIVEPDGSVRYVSR
jgi:soluble lytic murein transglycosylase-like protein